MATVRRNVSPEVAKARRRVAAIRRRAEAGEDISKYIDTPERQAYRRALQQRKPSEVSSRTARMVKSGQVEVDTYPDLRQPEATWGDLNLLLKRVQKAPGRGRYIVKVFGVLYTHGKVITGVSRIKYRATLEDLFNNLLRLGEPREGEQFEGMTYHEQLMWWLPLDEPISRVTGWAVESR